MRFDVGRMVRPSWCVAGLLRGELVRRDTRRCRHQFTRRKPHPVTDRKHEGGISITTLTARPKTPTQFGGLTLRPETLRAIQKLAWTEPTPIQTRVIPLMTEGRDLIGQAQTGSGKTGAYGIPLVERLDAVARALQALVLVPPRELALQVTEDLRVFAAERGITAVALFGGQPIERQFTALRRHPHIAVATPGRLLDHLQRRTVTLEAVTVVILDEAAGNPRARGAVAPPARLGAHRRADADRRDGRAVLPRSHGRR